MNWREVREAAEEQGFIVERTAGNHWRFIPPDPRRPMVIMSGTPSDRRTLKNLIAILRRSGFVFRGRGGRGSERDTSARQRAFVRAKVPILIHEGYPPKQAVAIAYRMAGILPRKHR